MEMVLVLAVMVAVAAIVLPALQGPLNDQRLRKAADLVLAQWATARVTALSTGRMQVFRYQSGTDQYQVQAWFSESDAVEASAMDEVRQPVEFSNPSQRPSSLGVAGVQLPDGITFFLGETFTDARLAHTGIEASADGGPTADQPIVFYPDGSASDARLVLTNERFYVELKLRGLTGLARASQLLSLEEIQP
jgi:hypothetical protein